MTLQVLLARLVRGILVAIFGLSLFGSLLISFLILSWQTLSYLQTGIWPPLSVADSLIAARPLLPIDLVRWVIQPVSWFGLHQIIVSTPLALAVVVVGFGFAFLIGHGTDGWPIWDDNYGASSWRRRGSRGQG